MKSETGIVNAIFVAKAAGAPMEAANSVYLRAGWGIFGDRYERKIGTFSDYPQDHQLTLVEAEIIESLAAEYGLTFAPGETRRNIVTRGIRLNDLVGKDFTIGDVLCHGTRLCDPCAHLEQITGKMGLVRVLAGRGGLRATITHSGFIRIGDAILPCPHKNHGNG